MEEWRNGRLDSWMADDGYFLRAVLIPRVTNAAAKLRTEEA
jgi:hypothetical protein